MKRLRCAVGGSQLLYVPILPKPVPTIPASNSVGGESSKDVVMSVVMPTNSQLPASDMTGIDLRQLLCNTLDLSSSSIVVAQTKSTPTVQNSGNMVTQRPLSAVTLVDESRSPVSTSGNPTAQGPASATVSGTETILPVHSSGNMVPQGQLSLSAVVSQTASTPAIHSSGNVVPQNLLPLSAAVSQTASTPSVHSSGNMLPPSQLPLSTVVSQTALTPSLQSSVSAVRQSQLAMLATVSQTASSQPSYSYFNTVPEEQLAIPTIVSARDFRLPVGSSANAVTQNLLPVATSCVAGNTSLSSFGTMTRQDEFPRSVGVPDGNMEQLLFATPSQSTSWNFQQGLGEFPAISGAWQVADIYTYENMNMLQTADTLSQMTNGVISAFDNPKIVSDAIATQPPISSSGLDPSNRLNILANITEVEREMLAFVNSSNAQVCIYLYLLSF
jgi:hypothetical protein